MSNFIKSLITENVDNFRTNVHQILAEKIVNSLSARKSEISVNLLEASDWILVFDFKSGDKKKVEEDLKKRFKKYFSGSGSMGRGFDLSFHGPKNDLQKIKTYVEKTYKKDLNIKYTTFMAESVAINENNKASHKGSCDEVHPDTSHEEWEEEQEGFDEGGCGCKKCAGLKESKMSELHMLIKQKKSAKQIAKIMKVDVHTIEVLMRGNVKPSLKRESYLYEERNKTDIPADKKTKDLIQSGKAKILYTGVSSIHKNARFVVVERPLGHKGKVSSNQDKVLMATISDPKGGRIKMFSYHGTHVNLAGAMKFAKNNKLIGTMLANKQLAQLRNTKESYLYERNKTGTTGLVYEFPNNRLASQFAKDMSNSGIATTELVDTTKVQVQMLPGNKSVGKGGLAKYLKKSRGKKLNESVISKIQEAYTSKMPVDIDIDGKIIHVTPDICEEIVLLHDELNADNQIRLRELINENIKSFVEISNFAKKRK